MEACLAAGMNRFVAKPVRRDVLLDAILTELSGMAAEMPESTERVKNANTSGAVI